MDKARIAALVMAAVEDVNKQLPRAKRLEVSPSAILTGDGGKLDSLGLVNLMFGTEKKIESELGLEITLADDALAASDETFHTLASFTDFVHALVEKKSNA